MQKPPVKRQQNRSAGSRSRPKPYILSYHVAPFGRVIIVARDGLAHFCGLDNDNSLTEAEIRCHLPDSGDLTEALNPQAEEWLQNWLVHDRLPPLPEHLPGTQLQCKVWNALREIPRGQTINYSELASKVGSPRAIRAVASACGKNPISFFIPCHRVIRLGGGMGGYAWGLPLKKTLLEREGANA